MRLASAAMSLPRFLCHEQVSLKICGVTRAEDATALIELGVPALGVNFWPQSKRYVEPAQAAWLETLRDQIVRVGVFVNAGRDLPLDLWHRGWIDMIQLHGDESPEDVAFFRSHGAQVIKAIGASSESDIARAIAFQADAVLLDAPAPGLYGGTGHAFDWGLASRFRLRLPETPLLLAGGIQPSNAAEAVAQVQPCAIDVASGGESAPGIKDLKKVRALLASLKQVVLD